MSLMDRNYILTFDIRTSMIKLDRAIELFNTDRNVFKLSVRIIVPVEGTLTTKGYARGSYITYDSNEISTLSVEELAEIDPDYKLKLVTVLPDNKTYYELEITDIIHEDGSDNALFKFNLDDTKYNTQIGKHQCEFHLQLGDELICSSPFSYMVKKSLFAR